MHTYVHTCLDIICCNIGSQLFSSSRPSASSALTSLKFLPFFQHRLPLLDCMWAMHSPAPFPRMRCKQNRAGRYPAPPLSLATLRPTSAVRARMTTCNLRETERPNSFSIQSKTGRQSKTLTSLIYRGLPHSFHRC